MATTGTSSRPEFAIGPEDRIIVIGTSGSGKTTFSDRLAEVLDLVRIELDVLFWDPDWTPVSPQIFRERVEHAVAAPGWVCDGNYGQVRDALWPRATTIVWLRYSFPRTLFRIVRRTLRRSITGEKICGENHESFVRSFFHRDSIIVWMLQTWGKHRRNIPALFEKPEHHHLRLLVCNHPRDAERILEASLALRSKSA